MCGCRGAAAARRRGTLRAEPLILGEDDEALPVRRVALLQSSGAVPAGATRYVRGTEVAEMIEDGRLNALDGL